MTVTVTDPALLAALLGAEGVVELQTPDGILFGRFTAEPFGVPPPGVVSPFTDEERAERRKQRSGRPLADILRDLRAKG